VRTITVKQQQQQQESAAAAGAGGGSRGSARTVTLCGPASLSAAGSTKVAGHFGDILAELKLSFDRFDKQLQQLLERANERH
jgi:hypothetical protein